MKTTTQALNEIYFVAEVHSFPDSKFNVFSKWETTNGTEMSTWNPAKHTWFMMGYEAEFYLAPREVISEESVTVKLAEFPVSDGISPFEYTAERKVEVTTSPPEHSNAFKHLTLVCAGLIGIILTFLFISGAWNLWQASRLRRLQA